MPQGRQLLDEARKNLATAEKLWHLIRQIEQHVHVSLTEQIAQGSQNLLPAADRARASSGFWGVPEEVMIDKALTWIESIKESGEPFFLNYNAVYPHHPFKVPAGHEQLYEMDWGEDKVRKRYRATLR